MPERSPSSPSHDRAHDARTVADVEAHAGERLGALRDGEHVRHVEDTHAADADPVSHGRRNDGVDHRKGLEADAGDLVRATAVEDVPVLGRDREPCHSPPGIARGMDGTRRAVSEPSGVVGMGMRDQDRLRAEAGDPSRPVLSAVDHHSTIVMSHQQGGVQSMEGVRASM
jgi:hypothetical protein